MDKKIIEKLEDIRNRLVQAHKIFSSAAYDISVTIESLDEEFKDNMESYVEEADLLYFRDDDYIINTPISRMESMIDSIHDLSEGAKWYISEQNGESMTFDEFKTLAMDSSPKNTDLIYEINRYVAFNSDSYKFDGARTGISKSFDDAKITLWRDSIDVCGGTFYEIIERTLDNFSYKDFRYWLFNEYGQLLDCAYSESASHLFRGFETVRFKPGEIVFFINRRDKTMEPCIIVELPYTIAQCWKLNNRLRDECLENEEIYTKAIYEQNIKGKDSYKIYTLNGKRLIDCPPISLHPDPIFEYGYMRMTDISFEDSKSLKEWYDDYISKNQEHDI